MPDNKIKSWIATHIFLSILSLAILIAEVIINTQISYRLGSNNDPLFALMSYSLPILLSACFMLFISLINIAIAISRSVKNKAIIFKDLPLASLPLIIILLIIPITSIAKPPLEHYFNGFEKWVENEVDVPAIRKWLNSLPDDYSNKEYYNIEKHPENLPEVITKFKPQIIYLSNFKHGRHIEFIWGGGFSMWGIIIGPEDMGVPEKYQLQITRPIQPGVYIFVLD